MKFIIYISPHVMVGKRLQITDSVQDIYDAAPGIEELYFRNILLNPKKIISHYFPLDIGEACLYTHKTDIVTNPYNNEFEKKSSNICIIVLTFITFMLGLGLLLRRDQI
jgi:hypothetical protein